MAVAANARFVSHRLPDCLAETNADVFHGMVLVDLQIPLCTNRQIDDGVFGEQLQHVIEKTNSRLDRRLAGAVEIQFELNLCLASLPLDLCGACHVCLELPTM